MTTAQYYFMVTASEQSLSKAADKLYTSQQNLSNHIKRLEQEYGVLFKRKPKFELTLIGEAVLANLQQISILEKDLDAQLREIKKDPLDRIRVGISTSRARILLPGVVARHREKFPHARLEFVFANNIVHEGLLRNGDIDLFLGIDSPRLSDFNYLPISKEKFFFVCSDEVALSHGIDTHQHMIQLSDVERFEYVSNPLTSHMQQKINAFMAEHKLYLRSKMYIDDNETKLRLAAQNEGACFSANMMLSRLEDINNHAKNGNLLRAYKVKNFNVTSDISIVTHRLLFKTDAIKELIRAFQEECRRY